MKNEIPKFMRCTLNFRHKLKLLSHDATIYVLARTFAPFAFESIC